MWHSKKTCDIDNTNTHDTAADAHPYDTQTGTYDSDDVPETQTQSPAEYTVFSEVEYHPDSQLLCEETLWFQFTDTIPETQTHSPAEYAVFSELEYHPDSQLLCEETPGFQFIDTVPDPHPAATSKDILVQVSNAVQAEHCSENSTTRDKPPLPPNKLRRSQRNTENVQAEALPPQKRLNKTSIIENEFVPTTYPELYARWTSDEGMPVITRDIAVQLSQNYGRASPQ